MKNSSVIGLAVVGGLLVGSASVYYFTKREATPVFTNLSLRSGDATVSAEFLNAQKAVEFYREAIRKKPEIVKNYVDLAQIYIQEARITALHHEYFPKAEVLLNKAIEIDPSDFNAIITKASMLATLHQFGEAKQLTQKAISLNPYNAFAYGVLCDTHVELGEYDEAVKASDKMLSMRPDLRSYARASYLREIHGDNEGAARAMQMAGESGVFGQENRAWAFYNLGKLYVNQGVLDTAEFIFKGILQERPKYAYAMAGLAQVRCAQNKYDEAVQLLKTAWETTPEHSFMEELANIYRATGKTGLANEAIELVMKEFSDHTQEGWNVDKEFAAFCANHDIHLDEALERARNEYNRRPNNIEALDTFAWTLYKNGNAAEAIPYIQRAMRLGTKNPAMIYHAGMIYLGTDNKSKALELLRSAVAINPYINVLYSAPARRALDELTDLASTN